MMLAQKLAFASSPANWKRSFWIVYVLVTFGLATLPNSLLGTLSVLLLAAPIYAFCFIGTFVVWRRSFPGASLQDCLAASLGGGIAVLWRSAVLFAPVLVVTYFQLHLVKAAEAPGTAVFAWPRSAPSVVLITALLVYVPLAIFFAARSSVKRGGERFVHAAAGSVASSDAPVRLSILVFAVLVAFACISVLVEGTGWRALVWPITGVRDIAGKVEGLWSHYDTSRPWRVGAIYVFGEEWSARIVKSGMDLNYYNIIELTPRGGKEPQGSTTDVGGEDAAIVSKIDSILIHSGSTFGSMGLERQPESGEFFCTRSPYDLIQCQLASTSPQATPANSEAYLADLISERRFDRDTERAMDPKKQHEIERKGVYVMSEGTKPSFFAHCDSGVCTAFSVYQTDDGKSDIEVVFSQSDLAHWRAIAGERELLLSRFHDRAEASLSQG